MFALIVKLFKVSRKRFTHLISWGSFHASSFQAAMNMAQY